MGYRSVSGAKPLHFREEPEEPTGSPGGAPAFAREPRSATPRDLGVTSGSRSSALRRELGRDEVLKKRRECIADPYLLIER